jgi:hypothetical protein
MLSPRFRGEHALRRYPTGTHAPLLFLSTFAFLLSPATPCSRGARRRPDVGVSGGPNPSSFRSITQQKGHAAVPLCSW